MYFNYCRLWHPLLSLLLLLLLLLLFGFCLRQGLVLSPRLECGGTYTAHCSFSLLGSSTLLTQPPRVAGSTDVCHHIQLIFSLFVEMGSHHVAQGGGELLYSSNPSTLASQISEITGVSHCAGLTALFSRQPNENWLKP
uniref:Uncharacterized protein n=1 Tax=Piliocolobus tephrosceles TaxID=591936 RepID=A0A8C9I003_9PRIM